MLLKIFVFPPLFLLLFLITGTWIFGISYNVTESVPIGFYQKTNIPIKKGVLVEICPPNREPFLTAYKRKYIGLGFCEGRMRPLLKKVAALQGDTISMTDKGILINGNLYKDSRPLKEDLYHRTFSKFFPKNYTLKTNEMLLLGENPASWDGRYFGLLPVNTIISAMKPIWIFK